MKSIEAYEIISHGICHPDYLQGCGVALADFDYVFTGAGDTEAEAFEDALEQLADRGWEITPALENEAEDMDAEYSAWVDCAMRMEDAEPTLFYVSIRVKAKGSKEVA